MTRTIGSNKLLLSNVHEDKAKCVEDGGGGGCESQNSIQAVKVQVLCSRRRVAFESSTTPVSTAWLCGGNCQVFELNSNQLGDLCCKCDLLGMMCLCSCPLLLTGAPSIFVPESYQFGLCRSVGIYCRDLINYS